MIDPSAAETIKNSRDTLAIYKQIGPLSADLMRDAAQVEAEVGRLEALNIGPGHLATEREDLVAQWRSTLFQWQRRKGSGPAVH